MKRFVVIALWPQLVSISSVRRIFGPFKSRDEALEWVGQELDPPWTSEIVELESPFFDSNNV